jgi:dihydropteroate synthase
LETRTTRRRYTLSLAGRQVELGERTWIVGVLNTTPDSFSDGGRHASVEAALRQGLGLFEAGADVVDVGGESTRPGARPVAAEEEIRRVAPVIEALASRGAGVLSVDTTKAAVARAALDAGAHIVNDVSGFRFDPELPRLVAERGVPAILMHLRGDFATMHAESRYARIGREVGAELGQAIGRAVAAGVAREQLVVDPGIGFSKRAGQSLELLRSLPELLGLDRPLLVGPSRKSFLGAVLDRPPEARVWGTAAAVAAAILGGAHLVRVHDVAEMRDVARVCDAILAGGAAA